LYLQFEDQVSNVGNASVVVGLHGAGLALSVFAPASESTLVEIVPQYHAGKLCYENIRSFGIDYLQVKLQGHMFRQLFFRGKLHISVNDAKRIEGALLEALVLGYRKVDVSRRE
jgi:hypothetical protein